MVHWSTSVVPGDKEEVTAVVVLIHWRKITYTKPLHWIKKRGKWSTSIVPEDKENIRAVKNYSSKKKITW